MPARPADSSFAGGPPIWRLRSGSLAPPRQFLPLWVYGAFLLASWLITGYRYNFGGNHPIQLPMVAQLNDPALYAGDPFVATFAAYASALWGLVAVLARWIPLPELLLALFVAERALCLWAGGALARALWPKRRLAELAALAVVALGPHPILGSGTIIENYFEQTGVAVALYTLAAAALLRGHALRCGLWFGLGLLCNSMYGVFAATYLVAAWLVRPPPMRDWPRWGGAAGLALLLAGPVLLRSLEIVGAGDGDLSLWVAAALTRTEHHLAPSSWPLVDFGRFGLLAAAICVAAVHAPRELMAPPRRVALTWTAVASGWLAAALLAEWLGNPTLLMLQPGRAGDLWYLWGTIALVVLIEKWCFAVPERISLYLPLVAVVLLFWGPPALLLVVAVVVLFGAQFVAGRARIWTCRRQKAVLLGLVVLLGVGELLARRRAVDAWGPAFARVPSAATVELGKWARQATPPDACFLTSTDDVCFRTVADRPVFLTWKDGAALMYDRGYTAAWVERLAAYGYDVRHPPPEALRVVLRRRYEALADADVLDLADRFGLAYWVASPQTASDLPLVFANDLYRVYALPPRVAAR